MGIIANIQAVFLCQALTLVAWGYSLWDTGFSMDQTRSYSNIDLRDSWESEPC